MSAFDRHARHSGPRFAALVLLAPVVAAALSGCGRPAGGGFKMPPMPVEVADVKSEPVSDRFRAVGTVDADETVKIVNEISAVVRELPFAEGQAVAQGDLIARLDDSELGADANRADALRDQARTNHERIRQLFEQKAASQQELDDASSALKVAEANAVVARTRFDKAHIRSPLTGVAGRRLVSPGAYLAVGTPITEVASIGIVKVGFSAPERYLPQLRRRAGIGITTTAYPGEVFEGDISVVDPILDPVSHTVQMVARVHNRDGRLRPGMSADVTAMLGERPLALTVPDEAIFSEGDQSFVYIVKPDSTVTRQAVVLGTRDSSRAEITQGLKAGDRVVRAGYQKLFEGAHVMPVPSMAGGPGATGAASGMSGGAAAGAGNPPSPAAKTAAPAGKQVKTTTAGTKGTRR
jgi:membrane fusion protein (multidrug efflux system)